MSDQAPLSAREGNFDDPPASARAAFRDSGDIEARLSHVRNVLQVERQRLNEARRTADAERRALHTPPMPSSPDTRRRMRTVLRRLRDNDAASNAAPPAAPSISRARPLPTGRRGEWSNRVLRDATESNGSLLELQDAMERLAQVNEDLRNLLERPLSDHSMSGPSRRRAAERPQDDTMDQPRRKRRRVDRAADTGDYPRVEYGHEGQVVPGRLKMKIVSCDGGTIGSPPFDAFENQYGAENVLKEDDSVYCTQSSRCNMVLCHEGGCTFSLERLVIRAPRQDFTDPVQEGLVFVSMKMDAAFDRTTQYQIYYFPTSRFASHFESDEGQGEESHTFQRDLRNVDCDSSSESDSGRPVQTVAASDDGTDSEENESVVSWGSSSSTGSTRPTHVQPHRRRSLPSHEEYDDILAQFDFDEVLHRGAEASLEEGWMPPSARRRPRSLSEDAHCPSPSLDLLRPTARFSMPNKPRHRRASDYANEGREKSNRKITIKFNPPVSGRYILLKLWNPRHGGNIDVQSIAAQGFAGVRWFPAVEMR